MLNTFNAYNNKHGGSSHVSTIVPAVPNIIPPSGSSWKQMKINHLDVALGHHRSISHRPVQTFSVDLKTYP